MTSSYRQNRTRLFLPIKGNLEISKNTISRRISYTIKLAYRKLTKRDISLFKIKAHEVRALSSSWAFFDKVPLNGILQWRFGIDHQPLLDSTSGTCLSKQRIYRIWAPFVVAQKVVGANRIQLRKHRQRQQPPTPAVTLKGT